LISHLMRKSTQRFLTQEDLDLRIQAVNEKFPLPQNNSQPVQSANIPKPISPANLIIDEWKPLV
jgi:type IV secretory pathway ATPase VirB11/archaellum biosynthesis ATPase